MLPYGIRTIGDLHSVGLKSVPYDEMRKNVLRAETAACVRQYKDYSKVFRWSDKTHYTVKTLAEFLGVRPRAAYEYLTLIKNKDKVRRVQSREAGRIFEWIIPKKYVVKKEVYDDYVQTYVELESIFGVSRQIIARLGLKQRSDGVSNRRYYSKSECERLLRERAIKKGN